MRDRTRALRGGIRRVATAVSDRLWDRLHAAYGLTDERAKVELYGHLLAMLTGFLDGILPDAGETPNRTPPADGTAAGADG